MMHGHEKSDSVIVAAKPANKVARLDDDLAPGSMVVRGGPCRGPLGAPPAESRNPLRKWGKSRKLPLHARQGLDR